MQQKPLIQLHHVSLSLGERSILQDINLEIQQGEFIAILGPNGSGKSTLLQLILGLIKPDSGTVSVFGNPVSTGNPNIGFSPQVKPFDPDIPITGKEYVSLGLVSASLKPLGKRSYRQERVMAVLEEFDATKLSMKKIGKMSGGEQQRISLAQSLVSDPHLLLLDEPLANLDISYQAEILQRLHSYHTNHRHTILLVAHDVNPLLPYIDRVIYLANTHATIGLPHEVITDEVLTSLYGVPVKVFEIEGRVFVAAFDGITH